MRPSAGAMECLWAAPCALNLLLQLNTKVSALPLPLPCAHIASSPFLGQTSCCPFPHVSSFLISFLHPDLRRCQNHHHFTTSSSWIQGALLQ